MRLAEAGVRLLRPDAELERVLRARQWGKQLLEPVYRPLREPAADATGIDFEKAYVVVSRRVQDQQGDLATRAEEGAVGTG